MLATELADLADEISLTPLQALGIPLALIGAVFLSLGTQFQHRGVAAVDGGISKQGASMGAKTLLRLLRRPSWVAGTIMLGLAVVFQLAALSLAPLIVVQPIGAVALVITTYLNARVARHKLDAASINAVLYCLLGIGVFVTIAAFFAVERPVDDQQLLTVLALLVVVAAGLGIAWRVYRRRASAIFYVVAAGVLYGFVVTLTKIVINRIGVLFRNLDTISAGYLWLTAICAVLLIVAMIAGGYFVQLAHASGPPDLVIAGLTVIDPLVAVLIGVAVLGEASMAPPWALIVFVATGAVAIFGVFQLAKHHPQLR